MEPPDLSISSQGCVLYLFWSQWRWCCCPAEWVSLQSCFHQTKSHWPQGGLRRGLRTDRMTQWCTALLATELCCPHDLSVLSLIWNKEAMWAANAFFRHFPDNSLILSLNICWLFFKIYFQLLKFTTLKDILKIMFHSQSHPHNCSFLPPCLPTYCLHCSNWLNTYSFLATMDKCKGVLQDEGGEVSVRMALTAHRSRSRRRPESPSIRMSTFLQWVFFYTGKQCPKTMTK